MKKNKFWINKDEPKNTEEVTKIAEEINEEKDFKKRMAKKLHIKIDFFNQESYSLIDNKNVALTVIEEINKEGEFLVINEEGKTSFFKKEDIKKIELKNVL